MQKEVDVDSEEADGVEADVEEQAQTEEQAETDEAN